MFTSKEILRLLRQKFKFADVKDRDGHIHLKLEIPGLAPIVTKVSHPKSTRATVGKVLESKMARQLGVDTPYFREMLSCTHSCDDYYDRLKAKQPPA